MDGSCVYLLRFIAFLVRRCQGCSNGSVPYGLYPKALPSTWSESRNLQSVKIQDLYSPWRTEHCHVLFNLHLMVMADYLNTIPKLFSFFFSKGWPEKNTFPVLALHWRLGACLKFSALWLVLFSLGLPARTPGDPSQRWPLDSLHQLFEGIVGPQWTRNRKPVTIVRLCLVCFFF